MNANEIRSKTLEYMKEKGITMEFTQIPEKVAEKMPMCDKHSKMSQAHWHVEVSRNGNKFCFQFHEGEGHFIKQRFGSLKYEEHSLIEWFKYNHLEGVTGEDLFPEIIRMKLKGVVKLDRVQVSPRVRVKPPHPADVFYCICNDYLVADYSTFEDWAGCYGYEEDSRSAEKAFNSCVELAVKMRKTLSDTVVRELDEITWEL